MRKDYLAAYLAQAPASFEIPTSSEVSKVSKPPFDTFDTGQRVGYAKTQATTGGGFDTFGTALGVEYPKTRGVRFESGRLDRPLRISPHTTSRPVSKVSKPVRKKNASPLRRRGKVWRRAPYWQACAEATQLASGALDLENADLLYAALALRAGHTSDEVCEMLQKVTPLASHATDYCAQVVRRASINPTSYITAELAAKYVAAHPFAWELELKPSELAGVQVVEGVQ